MILERVVPHRVAVVAAEPVAPVVPLAAELRLARLSVNLARVGANPQVAAVDVDLGSYSLSLWERAGVRVQRRQRPDHPPAVAIPDIQPIIEPPPQAVHAVLLVPFAEALVKDLPHVRLVVAARVLGIQDV